MNEYDSPVNVVKKVKKVETKEKEKKPKDKSTTVKKKQPEPDQITVSAVSTKKSIPDHLKYGIIGN